jgi:hypothetical protein
MVRVARESRISVWYNLTGARTSTRAMASNSTANDQNPKLELKGHSGPASIQIRPQTLWPSLWLPPGVDGALSSTPGHTQSGHSWSLISAYRAARKLKMRNRGGPPGFHARRSNARKMGKQRTPKYWTPTKHEQPKNSEAHGPR